MKVTLENGEIVIRIPANTTDPKLSSSGKTRLIATSNGSVKTDVTVLGKQVTVGVNCYIKA